MSILLLFQDKEKQKQNKAYEQLSLNPKVKQVNTLNTLQVQRILNRKRSKEYVAIMKSLDAGGHMHNQSDVERIINAIREEMPEIEINLGPIGIVSKCYLGAPYEVHTLSVEGAIIEHYQTYRPLPNGLEKARKLATSGYYAFIEVYPTEIRAVKDDGTVATLKG